MLRRLGVLGAVLALAMLLASPAMAQQSLAEQIIDRTFDDVFGSPSQSQYDRPGDDGDVFLPAGVGQGLCGNIVQNSAFPLFVQVEIAQEFELDCEPSGSFFDSFFNGFPF